MNGAKQKQYMDDPKRIKKAILNMDRFEDPCFYVPEKKRAAYWDEVHAKATWIVGFRGKWRLCDSCAALPEFKKYRKRKKIERKEKKNE